MSNYLFSPLIGLKRVTKHWYLSKDGRDYPRQLFHRHYSYKPYADGRDPKLFVGPGEKLVLVREGGLFVWRKFISGDGQEGVGCSIFRNESKEIRSSDLILDAEKAAFEKWGETRLYTWVAPKKVRSSNPGYCFKKAGWEKCGVTKVNKLLIFEKQLS
tara:strand:+ start:349 stop:822 length:474 start_codon:yes stop_codon:yes gene_type:complete